jgi:hypothetical protein
MQRAEIVDIDISPRLLACSKEEQVNDLIRKLENFIYIEGIKATNHQQPSNKSVHINVPSSLINDTKCEGRLDYLKKLTDLCINSGVSVIIIASA